METMRAIRMHEYGGPGVLRLEEVRRPEPGRGEILVRVHAAGVNPVDGKTRSGRGAAGRITRPFPIILGWDFSGTVEALGEGVTEFAPGAEVYGMVRIPDEGTYAEYVVVPVEHAAPKPKTLGHEEAAAVPLVALTAHQALFGAANLSPGQTVLIHAGAGGVGHVAVQFARGCRVLATASARNHDFVRSLGAAQVIDYENERFEERVRGADVVLDTVGGEVQIRSFSVLKWGGTLVSIRSTPSAAIAEQRGVRAKSVFVQPNGEQLRRLAARIDAREVRPRVTCVLSLADAGLAQSLVEQGHTRGKIVLRVAETGGR
ncbi:NADP-dependent oxidoreductase [Polyangium sp. 6x1]|uniref:NADP-dependent oxidoreductase n=1 Tax=Polyangium sp. 6x1 TaxID=3042689 RepID=UPI00248224FE|nr:NADP-dependent oxidoreductase [Polyangium sp. 6x1]MDI1444574.1 NADP-dependent oxidoreductase [Polyangium sp. 6x1]